MDLATTEFQNVKGFKKSFFRFLIISGLGTLWLTYSWTTAQEIISWFILRYYIFNSALLLLIGFSFKANKAKLFCIASIILFLSVIASFILINGDGPILYDSIIINNEHVLYVSTIIQFAIADMDNVDYHWNFSMWTANFIRNIKA